MQVLNNSGEQHECFAKKWRNFLVIVQKVVESFLHDTNPPTLNVYRSGYMIVRDAYRCIDCPEEYHTIYKAILENYVILKVLPKLVRKNGEILLEELLQQWTKYQILRRLLFKIFRYLNNNYFIGKTSHLIFYYKVYVKIKNQVRDALIHEINRERNGEEINHKLMKDVVKIYFPKRNSTEYYKKDFEKAMLEDTAKFYSRKALEWLLLSSDDDSPYDSYMHKVKNAMTEEETRVTKCMDSSSVDCIKKVMDYQLLHVYERKLQDMVKQ